VAGLGAKQDTLAQQFQELKSGQHGTAMIVYSLHLIYFLVMHNNMIQKSHAGISSFPEVNSQTIGNTCRITSNIFA
jgi:hypothetical protein